MKTIVACLLALSLSLPAPLNSVQSEPVTAPEPDTLTPVHVRPDVAPGENYVAHLTLNEEVNSESAQRLIREVRWANEDEATAIVLEINSPGGSVFDGFDLARAIEDSEVPVQCVVDMLGASMAYYLLQSCHYRSMTKRATLMAHEPLITGFIQGHPYQIRQLAERLQILADALAEHMSARLTVSKAYYLEKVKNGAQWWMGWSEAQKAGAVDSVVKSVRGTIEAWRANGAPPESI